MPIDDNIHVYLKKAEQALISDDKRATGILVKQVLKSDFTNERAWKLLYRLMGDSQSFEDFRFEFASRYYPDKIYLLPKVVPGWLDEIEASCVEESIQSLSPANIPPPITRASSRFESDVMTTDITPTPSASIVPTEPTFVLSISADKIAALVDKLGRQDDVTAQQSIENLIRIGHPAVDLLIDGLQHGGSIFDSKRKEKDMRCERASRALIGIGVPAIKSLLKSALDKPHFVTATEASKAIVQIGVSGLDILIDQIVHEERLSERWHTIDGILSEILGAPTHKQVAAMLNKEKWAKIAMVFGGIVGGFVGLSSNELIWLPVSIVAGGYLLWSFVWCRWVGTGLLGLIVMGLSLVIAPFRAIEEIATRKLAEQLRQNMVEKLLQSKIHQPSY